jgi:hypothetical protein
MPTGPPLEPEKRAAILADIEARQLGRNAIARKHRVGLGTVTTIAHDAGIYDAFDRAQTARATADRQADMKARRTRLAEDLLDDAERIRDRLFDPYSAALTTRDGVEVVELLEPDAASLRNFATSIAVLLDKHIALDRHDADGGLSEVGSMLDGLLDKFGLRKTTTPAPDPPAPAPDPPAPDPAG